MSARSHGGHDRCSVVRAPRRRSTHERDPSPSPTVAAPHPHARAPRVAAAASPNPCPPGRISAEWGSPVCIGPWPSSAARELRIAVVTSNLRRHVSSWEINPPSSSRACSKSLSAGCARGDLTFAEVASRGERIINTYFGF
jgi:hypothetical protein